MEGGQIHSMNIQYLKVPINSNLITFQSWDKKNIQDWLFLQGGQDVGYPIYCSKDQQLVYSYGEDILSLYPSHQQGAF